MARDLHLLIRDFMCVTSSRVDAWGREDTQVWMGKALPRIIKSEAEVVGEQGHVYGRPEGTCHT
jgi:hypothetical protein